MNKYSYVQQTTIEDTECRLKELNTLFKVYSIQTIDDTLNHLWTYCHHWYIQYLTFDTDRANLKSLRYLSSSYHNLYLLLHLTYEYKEELKTFTQSFIDHLTKKNSSSKYVDNIRTALTEYLERNSLHL